MWAKMGILMSGLLIAIIETPYLVRSRLYKELCCFFILLLIGMILSIFLSAKMKLPNPLDWISAVYKPMSDFLFNLLK